uniref:(northern house mosquito) hypothetical protein n=1 Tax=Culex pipiens TaxID=7175 RepID=A0A8D8FM04_CULPI
MLHQLIPRLCFLMVFEVVCYFIDNELIGFVQYFSFDVQRYLYVQVVLDSRQQTFVISFNLTGSQHLVVNRVNVTNFILVRDALVRQHVALELQPNAAGLVRGRVPVKVARDVKVARAAVEASLAHRNAHRVAPEHAPFQVLGHL